MDSLNKVDDQWIPLQIKVFSRWVSSKLQGHSNIKVEDITKDLSNGVALCDLATYLTHKNAPRAWAKDPKRTVDMVQNCELAVDMFDKDGVRLVGISGKDINDNNEKLILGLIWSLILHYQIGSSFDIDNSNSKENTTDSVASKAAKNQKEALLSWASDRTANYPNINNFKPFDLSLCALLDTYVPEKINYYQLDPTNSRHNSELATNVMNELGIPVFVYPEELQKHDNVVDEKTLLTQLSIAKVVLDKLPKEDLSHLLAAEEANKLADEAAADAEDKNDEGYNDDDDDDDENDDVLVHPEESDQEGEKESEGEGVSVPEDINGPEPTNTENPEWVIDDDAALNNQDATNPEWTNTSNDTLTRNRSMGDQSGTSDSLIDLSVVPQTNQSASILASGAEWVENNAKSGQTMETRPAESAQNLIDFSGTSDEQTNGENDKDAEADSKLVQDRSVPTDQNNNDTEDKKQDAENESDSEEYNDAVLVWVNDNIENQPEEEPTWIIGDDDADVILLPDDHPWELDSDAKDGIVDNVLPWVISDNNENERSVSSENNGEEVLDWVVVDEMTADGNENGEEEGNTEPSWVILDPADSYGLPEPDVQRWDIDDATAEAVRVKMAEESLEDAILSREVSFPDPNEHGKVEDNDESAADYSSRFMFVDVKSWF